MACQEFSPQHAYEIVVPIHFGGRLAGSFGTGLGRIRSYRWNGINL